MLSSFEVILNCLFHSEHFEFSQVGLNLLLPFTTTGKISSLPADAPANQQSGGAVKDTWHSTIRRPLF